MVLAGRDAARRRGGAGAVRRRGRERRRAGRARMRRSSIVSMIGAAGRIYMSGDTASIERARDEITRCSSRSRAVSTDQAAIDRLAAAAVECFDVDPEASVRLINVSENWTYRIEEPEGGRAFALRVHRPTYHTAAEIASELDWTDALREDGVVETAVAVAGVTGNRVCQVRTDDRASATWCSSSGCRREPGADAHDLRPGFHALGAVSARMHGHSRHWSPPAGFARFRWDLRHHAWCRRPLGAVAGRARDGRRGTRAPGAARCDHQAAARAFGQGRDRFGLVHADIRLANLLAEGDHVRVIDFDDCGWSWFMYDFATTVSFIEDHPRCPRADEAWVEGYRTVAALDPAERPSSTRSSCCAACCSSPGSAPTTSSPPRPPSSAPGSRRGPARWPSGICQEIETTRRIRGPEGLTWITSGTG